MTLLEKLIARARMAMNVMLAACLVGLWAGFNTSNATQEIEEDLTLLNLSLDRLAIEADLRLETPLYVQQWFESRAFSSTYADAKFAPSEPPLPDAPEGQA